MKQWKSIAEWYDHSDETCEITSDLHDTKEQAEAVCHMLRRDGWGGEGRKFPDKTYVEFVEDPTKQPLTCNDIKNMRQVGPALNQDWTPYV